MMRTISTAAVLLLALVVVPGTGHAQDGTDKVEALGAPDYDFAPMNITVTAGTTVEWVNVGAEYHTITANDTNDDGDPIFNGEVQGDGDTYTYTFDEPGTFDYYCMPHVAAGMVGTVTVEAADNGNGNGNGTGNGAAGGNGNGDDQDSPAPGLVAVLVGLGLALVAYRRR